MVKVIRSLNSRGQGISFHIYLGLGVKILATLSTYIAVPLLLKILTNEDYGVWISLGSVLIWAQFFDIGIGNGLKNSLVQLEVEKSFEQQRRLISTAYYLLLGIACGLFLVLLVVDRIVDWNDFFGLGRGGSLNRVFLMVMLSYCLQLVLNVALSIFQAYKLYSINDVFAFVSQIVTLLFIVVVYLRYGTISLSKFAIIVSAIPVLVLVVINYMLFRQRRDTMNIRIEYFSKTEIRSLLSKGIGFMITKAGAIMLMSSDSLLIAYFLGAANVVPYNMTYKYFSVALIFFGVIINPFWVAFADAINKGERDWIIGRIKRLILVWSLVPVMLSILVWLGPLFFHKWSQGKIEFDFTLGLTMAIYVSMYSFNMIFNQFINATGKIFISIIISVVILILNIPLSKILAVDLDLGPLGVLLATIVLYSLKVVVFPVQFHKVINKRALGIWSK